MENVKFLKYLRLADEIVLISHNPEELQGMMEQLNVASNEVKLEINYEKTKVMFNEFCLAKEITVGIQEIERLSEYIYLGELRTPDRSIDEEISKRELERMKIPHKSL